METTKEKLLAGLSRFIAQRPGLDFNNYGDSRSYRAELRAITRQRHDAERLLAAVSWRGITAEDILRFTGGGRLECDGGEWSYTAGQYWCVEYRRAAAALLASCLWAYWRQGMSGDNVADRLRAMARREFGRGIASRYFN
ncbi:MAG: hypothetical protein EBR82_10495 [Caulobacteraceae bacterium]|nr:hypothetical protein [Caulobacteraceae bacterium]